MMLMEGKQMDSAIWGLLGTIVGASASIATAWISAQYALNLQRDSHSLERIELARTFQRNNLLDLQDAMHDAMRMITRAHLEDTEAYRRNGEWGKALLSDEVNDGVRTAMRRVSILIERVADDSIRSDLKNLASMSGPVLFAKSQRQAEASYEAIGNAAQDVLQRLGAVLRSLY
jgi:hypothetical protein